jgi:hypothetical protein
MPIVLLLVLSFIGPFQAKAVGLSTSRSNLTTEAQRTQRKDKNVTREQIPAHALGVGSVATFD